jgi:hypothetical protein
MAFLYRRTGGRIEIREAHSTPSGPRSRTLASFQGALTEEHLDRAEARATRPFDRAAIREKAARLGVAVLEPRADAAARALLSALRRNEPLDPRLATLLGAALAERAAEPLPTDLAEVGEWLGASDLERGRALRDVLRLYDAIARSRGPVRTPPAARFPRFQSRPQRDTGPRRRRRAGS